jgi:hypothetical protein
LKVDFAVDIKVTETGKNKPEYTLNSDLDGRLTLQDSIELIRQTIIATSIQVLREEQARGFDKEPARLVDGSATKSLLSVKPFGTVIFERKAETADLLLPLYDTILRLSPVDTGQYKENHVVFVNRKVIADSRESLVAWINAGNTLKELDIIHFANVMPYAGKLERIGTTSKRQLRKLGKSKDKKLRSADSMGRVRMPNGTYALAARSFRRINRTLAQIRFEWMNGSALGIIPGVNAPLVSKRGKKLRYDFIQGTKRASRHRGPYVFPTIRIFLRQGSVKK